MSAAQIWISDDERPQYRFKYRMTNVLCTDLNISWTTWPNIAPDVTSLRSNVSPEGIMPCSCAEYNNAVN